MTILERWFLLKIADEIEKRSITFVNLDIPSVVAKCIRDIVERDEKRAV